MKTLQFIAMLLFFSQAKAQFTEGYFELLSKKTGNHTNAFFGISVPDGVLGACLTDSASSAKVQWVKLADTGVETFYSSNLPNVSQDGERILNLFESGNNQYLITSTIGSPGASKINLYHFENYSTSIAHLSIPIQMRNVAHQVYFRSGKFYLFYVKDDYKIYGIVIAPETMTIEQNEFLASEAGQANASLTYNIKPFFVHFENNSDFKLYSSNNDSLLYRSSVQNFSLQEMESHTLPIGQIVDLDTTSNQLVTVFYNTSSQSLNYYNLPTTTLSTIQWIDSVSLQDSNNPIISGLSSLIRRAFIYHKMGTKELLYNFHSTYRTMILFENKQFVDSKQLGNQVQISTLGSRNGLPFITGQRAIFTGSNALFLSNQPFENLDAFTEYFGFFPFGNDTIYTGMGNTLIPVPPTPNTKNYKFRNMIYGLFQDFSGRYSYYGNPFHISSYESPFWAGPYTDVDKYDQQTATQFNDILYVDHAMMNHHVYSINTQVPGYVPAKAILKWPAHGNTSKGQAANLADFIDVNGNGIYEPMEGDFPAFPGTRCLLNITHQDIYSGGLELHTYLYNFDCNDTISDVLFIRTEVYHRGVFDYDSLAFGNFADFDLGYGNDDYSGTNVNKGLIYAYNGDAFDEGGNGFEGFGADLPSIGVQFLKGIPTEANSIDDAPGIGTEQTVNGFGYDDGIIDNEYKGLEYSFSFSPYGPFGSPGNSLSLFNYLTGKWYLGDTLYFGGSGYVNSPSQSDIPSRYIYPNDSDPLFYGTNGVDPSFHWTESQAGMTPGDRRMLGSFGSTSLAPGESIVYHSAVLSGKRVQGAIGASLVDLEAKADHVKRAFNSDTTSCGQSFKNLIQSMITSVGDEPSLLTVKIYPNPFTDVFTVDLGMDQNLVSVNIYDIQGKIIQNFNTSNTVFEVQLTDQQTGLYFIEISGVKGKAIHKILKN